MRARRTIELKWFFKDVHCDECLSTWSQDFPNLQATRENKDEKN
jgi:hypothetical protein